jgi:hypothetical protein
MNYHKHPLPLYLALTIVISLTFNWFVQLFYYMYEININPQAFAGVKTLFDYQTGIIGDVLLLPIINMLILFVFISLPKDVKKLPFLGVAVAGALGDFFMHFMQGHLKLTNWSMPHPFEWNFVTYWHMFSLFFQLGFIFAFFYLMVCYWRDLKKDPWVMDSAAGVISLLLVFIILFMHDYNFLFGL